MKLMTIYILCWNEEILLPYTLDFYRKRFPDAYFVIVDNESTDRTVEIARSQGCEIHTFASQNKLSDSLYKNIKNQIWKAAKSSWIAIVDCDEWLDINQISLYEEIEKGTTLIRSEAYNMINMENNLNIANINHGYRDKDVMTFYDKIVMFDRTKIKQINYCIGAHAVQPYGDAQFSVKPYRLFHYKYLSPDYMVERYKLYASRLSDENVERGWGGNYLETEGTIRALFEEYRLKANKII